MTLQERLRDLSAYKHSDCTIGAEAADELDRLASENEALRKERDALQSKIDALMLEFCPNEMTPEQTARWALSQVPVPQHGDEYALAYRDEFGEVVKEIADERDNVKHERDALAAALEVAQAQLGYKMMPTEKILAARDALVRAEERERCAKVFEDEDGEVHEKTAKAWRNPAAAIRAIEKESDRG